MTVLINSREASSLREVRQLYEVRKHEWKYECTPCATGRKVQLVDKLGHGNHLGGPGTPQRSHNTMLSLSGNQKYTFGWLSYYQNVPLTFQLGGITSNVPNHVAELWLCLHISIWTPVRVFDHTWQLPAKHPERGKTARTAKSPCRFYTRPRERRISSPSACACTYKVKRGKIPYAEFASVSHF